MSLFDFAPLSSETRPDENRPACGSHAPPNARRIHRAGTYSRPGQATTCADRKKHLSSLILWGPPGSGKTTLASLIAKASGSDFIPFSAVLSGIKEIKAVMADAEKARQIGQRPVLFVDEIHRFNKAQQDAFLPYVERGDVILIGATTENPSFEVVSALLSRTKVYSLHALSTEEIVILLTRALQTEGRGLGHLHLQISDELLEQIAISSSGDARSALNTLELAAAMAQGSEIDVGNCKRCDAAEGAAVRQSQARSISTSSPLYTNRCDRAIRMPRCIGLLA